MATGTVRVRAAIVAAGLGLAVAVTGCTASGSKSGSSGALGTEAGAAAATYNAGASSAPSAAPSAAASAAPAAPGSAAPAAGATAAAATSAAGGSSAPGGNGLVEKRPPFQTDPTAGRSIIYTARIDLQVPTAADVGRTAQKIADGAEANGYVFSRSDQEAPDNSNVAPSPATRSAQPADVATADLVLKIAPGSAYDGLITKILGLGKKLDFNEKTSDVTSQMVDTQSRLTAQKASVARIRALLDKATTIGQIVQVEGELTRREADLESLEGTLAVLKSQTALATITVHLESAPVPTPSATPTPTIPPKPTKHIHGFTGGLKAGSHSFVTATVGVATVLGALLPYLALAVALALVVWFARRSWTRGRRTAPPAEQVTS